jgi:adenosylmethionine-8-amino-7-oxononanoate aminotransferase
MHAYTYSGHPTCCAVALRNLEIIDKEGLVERAEKLGSRLLAGLRSLMDLKAVGEVRGLGLMCAVELVADRATKAAFDPAKNAIGRIKAEMEARGLFTRVVRDIILLAPPLVVTEAQVDRIVEIVGAAIHAVLPDRA